MVHNYNATLPAFTPQEYNRAKRLLATLVAQMMGRKLEEDDWNRVYCDAKGIPRTGWSNLNIDVNFRGLGVEQKILRCSRLRNSDIKSTCGTTMMHPAATRSIRIARLNRPPNDVMRDVFDQYGQLVEQHRSRVAAGAPNGEPDMRTGWLLWEDNLTEFLYFEHELIAPEANDYYAVWNQTPARGARKASKSLWIYEQASHQKRYSVTTSAGIKIQPYFDVPSPSDPNLYHFRVQSERVSVDTVIIWVTDSTARSIRDLVGSLEKDKMSEAIVAASRVTASMPARPVAVTELAQPIPLTVSAFDLFSSVWDGVSDEHRAQLLLEALRKAK